ncbi:MAG: serine/threonine protein kinase [Planctomycetes bacterium]|nr:serine/threonine protein kinase [Planctomycetota bacterium]
MTTACTTCGAPVDTKDAPCPRCLFALAFTARDGGAHAHSRGREVMELEAIFPDHSGFELVGRGGMGAVYRATHPRLARTVAIKLLRADLARSPDFAERFLREARALARLAHPSIVALHDAGEREGRLYLVMEHVDGANLRRLLRDGRLAPARALALARDLCCALEFAHAAGVIHRDLKPENVLVDAQGRVKLADFGLAKLPSDDAPALTGTGDAMGTPHYMAPEQLERPRAVDARADLYALGVVLYEMLTGVLPLGRYEPPSRRAEVELDVDLVVERALARDPERRYADAGAMRAELERALEALATPTTASAARAPATSGASKRHWKGALGSFVLLLVAWAFCAHAFDRGFWPLVGSAPVLALVLFAVFTWRLRTSPELSVRLANLSMLERVGRVACGLVLFAASFALLVFALQSTWALGTTLWDPEYGALEPLRAASAGEGRALIDALARHPELAFLGALLLLFAGLGLSAATRGGWRSWRVFWRPVVATTALYGGSVALLILAFWGVAELRRAPARDVELSASASTDATLEELRAAAARALDDERWRVTRALPLVEPGAAAPSGWLLEAKSADWGGAWRIGLDGPLAARPPLVLVLRQDADRAASELVVHGGVAVEGSRQVELGRAGAQRVLEAILARLARS